MTPEEITAIASEYAKEMAIKDREEGFPESMIKSMISVSEYDMKSAIEFLERRFFIIQKETISNIVKAHCKEVIGTGKGSRAWFFYKGRIELLKSIFPGLGKEVES